MRKETASVRPVGRFRPPAALLAAVWPLVRGKLDRVEEEVQRNLRSPWGPIDRAGRYLAEAGGKRIRPILVLLTAGLLGYRGEDDVLLGSVFELIHTATLVHDDIIDEAETRRGRPAANRVFGNEFTVLLGDYLYIPLGGNRGGELRFLRNLILVIAGVVVVIALVLAYRGFRVVLDRWLARLAGRTARGARSVRARVEFYRRLEGVLARFGLVRFPSQTQREFAREAGRKIAESTGESHLARLPGQVVEDFYRVRFGSTPLDSPQADAVEQALRQLRQAAAGRQ